MQIIKRVRRYCVNFGIQATKTCKIGSLFLMVLGILLDSVIFIVFNTVL